MGKIVVAKLIRLGKDGDTFNKKLVGKVLRERAIVEEAYVKEFNKNWKTSGQLYEINTKATTERNKSLDKKAEDKNSPLN